MSLTHTITIVLAILAILRRFYLLKETIFEFDCTKSDKIDKFYSPCVDGYRSLYMADGKEKTGFTLPCESLIFDAFSIGTCVYKNASNYGAFGFIGGIVMLMGNVILLGFMPFSLITRMFACLTVVVQINGTIFAPQTMIIIVLAWTFTADIVLMILVNWVPYLVRRLFDILQNVPKTQEVTRRTRAATGRFKR
jgi:hypothetical protein